MKPLLTCRQLTDFLDDYIAGILPDGDRSEFDRHLALCQWCVDYLVSYRETIRLGRSAFENPDEPVPEEAPEELIGAVLAALARERGR